MRIQLSTANWWRRCEAVLYPRGRSSGALAGHLTGQPSSATKSCLWFCTKSCASAEPASTRPAMGIARLNASIGAEGLYGLVCSLFLVKIAGLARRTSYAKHRQFCVMVSALTYVAATPAAAHSHACDSPLGNRVHFQQLKLPVYRGPAGCTNTRHVALP